MNEFPAEFQDAYILDITSLNAEDLEWMEAEEVHKHLIYAEEKSQGEKTKREKANLDRIKQMQLMNQKRGRFY